MVLIPGGSFTMGDPEGRPDETPHRVDLSAFYMDRFPVTQEIYRRVLGINPSRWKGETNPVERIQWAQAIRFCNRCSEIEGLAPCYNIETGECDFEAGGYRLPTEAEWEYACRAGGEGRYFFGDNAGDLPRYAWLKPHSRGRPRPVGGKRPNRWGLQDMHGNVWEWCNDYYGKTYYDRSPRENPRGPAEGTKRVLRGGAWDSGAEQCRAAYRFQEFPVFSDACFGSDSYGFRRVRSAGRTPGKAAAPELAVPAAPGGETGTAVETAPEPPSAPAREVRIDPARLRGSIVFASDRGGALDIWLMDATGKNPRPLTRDSHPDGDPRFSPDGKRILYTSVRDGFPEVWMMNRDGSGPEKVTGGCQGAWSPRGESIVLIRDGRALIRELSSGRETFITPEDWTRCGVPAFSPNGSEVALASRHLGRMGIFILDLRNGGHRQLETGDPSCTPRWRRDGKRLVFQTVKGHIHQLSLEDGTEEQVTYGGDIQHDACYSPDGSLIAFCRAPAPEGPWQICIADLESEDLDFVQITGEGSNSLPDWRE